MDAFKRAHSDTLIEAIFLPSGSGLSSLHHGIVDAYIAAYRPLGQGLTCQELFSFTPRLLIHDSHPLAAKGHFAFFDLLEYDIALPLEIGTFSLIESYARQRGVSRLSLKGIGASSREHAAFLRAGGAILVLGNSQMLEHDPECRLLPLRDDKPLRIPVYLVFYDDKISPGLIALKESLADCYQKNESASGP